jgi:hypothetical protein
LAQEKRNKNIMVKHIELFICPRCYFTTTKKEAIRKHIVDTVRLCKAKTTEDEYDVLPTMSNMITKDTFKCDFCNFTSPEQECAAHEQEHNEYKERILRMQKIEKEKKEAALQKQLREAQREAQRSQKATQAQSTRTQSTRHAQSSHSANSAQSTSSVPFSQRTEQSSRQSSSSSQSYTDSPVNLPANLNALLGLANMANQGMQMTPFNNTGTITNITRTNINSNIKNNIKNNNNIVIPLKQTDYTGDPDVNHMICVDYCIKNLPSMLEQNCLDGGSYSDEEEEEE